MIKVAPSILSADFVNLERDIRHLQESGADYVHIDVMDGLFVPNITIGIPVVAAIRKITDLPLDVHLMIDRPIRYVEQFCDAGADIVTIHAEADTVENNQEALKMIRRKGVRAAVSIKPGTQSAQRLSAGAGRGVCLSLLERQGAAGLLPGGWGSGVVRADGFCRRKDRPAVPHDL